MRWGERLTVSYLAILGKLHAEYQLGNGCEITPVTQASQPAFLRLTWWFNLSLYQARF
jgi:hypothetical protein